MRILDVTPRPVVPPRRGSAVRTYALARHLSERHEVRQFAQVRRLWLRRELQVTPTYRVVSYASPLATAMGQVGDRSWVRTPLLSGRGLALARPAALRRLFEWAEVALVQFPWQFEACRRANPGRPLVYSSHNVERLKFESWAEAAGRPRTTGLWLRAVERDEARAVAHADLVLAVSPEDRRAFVERYGADERKIVVVPNGADTQRYRPVSAEQRQEAKRRLGLPDRPTALFAGADIPPNRRGLEWVCRAAELGGPFTFLVVGPLMPPSASGNLIATGLVDDFRPFLEAADVALCPIEHGGGTKIKLLEAFAAGLPVVAFAESLAGTEARPGEHVLLVDKDAGAIVHALDSLAGDGALRARLGAAARELAVERYAWRTIVDRLEAELLRLVTAS